MDLGGNRTIHLIGICGTGMGSLAGLLKAQGFAVRGSDEDPQPPIATMLESQGIPVLKGYRPGNLDPAPDIVVVGNVSMSGRTEFLLGSVPNRVSHAAPCTVVIVNTRGTDGGPAPPPREEDASPVAASEG